MENADIAFTTMLGSAEKADSFLRQLQQFAATTPFEFPELQTAASSLISAGISADKVIPIMTSLGNATSGMGTGSEGVQRATVALQQMAAAGRITAEDLNQLRDAGVPVFDLLTAATGKTKAEVAAMAATGKLGAKEMQQLFTALETGKGLERFNGLMAAQSQSLNGMFSTLKDNVNLALAGLITPAIPAIKQGLGIVASAVAGLPSSLAQAKTSLAGFAPLVGLLGTGFRTLGTIVSTVVGPALTALGTFIRNNQTTIGAAVVAIGTYVGIVKAVAIASKLWAITTGLITAAQVALNLAMTANPIGLVVVALAALTAGLVYAYKNSETFRSVVNSAFTTLRIGALQAVQIVVGGLRMLASVYLTVMGGLVGAAAKAFGWVPGVGGKLKGAAAAFSSFKTGALANLDAISAKAKATQADLLQTGTPGAPAVGRPGVPAPRGPVARTAAVAPAGGPRSTVAAQYNGPITVQASDPAQMERSLRQRRRLQALGA